MATSPELLNRVHLLRNLLHAAVGTGSVPIPAALVEEDAVQEQFILKYPGTPGNPGPDYLLEGVVPGESLIV